MKGVTAEEMKKLKEEGDSVRINEYFYEAQFTPYTFTIKA